MRLCSSLCLLFVIGLFACGPGVDFVAEGEVVDGEGEGVDEGEGEGEGEVVVGEGEVGEGEVVFEGEGEGVFEGEGEGDVDVGGEGEGEPRCANRDQTPGDPCATGLGACLRRGLLACADVDAFVCSAVPGEPLSDDDTSADGVDDDCDGDVDEDRCLVDVARHAVCSAGVGACARGGTLECTDNALACTAIAADAAEGDATDDGVDDDCDGVVDEDVLPCTQQLQFGAACDSGVGACLRSGSFVCTADGQEVACDANAATPTTTNDASLNGVDDDCDGATDEDVVYPDRVACDPAATCCFENVYAVARDGFFHVDSGGDRDAAVCDPALGSANPTTCKREPCTDIFHQLVWPANPPASGPHYGCTWGRWGALYNESEPLPTGYWIHNVEHGGAVFLYGPTATDAARTELLAAFNALTLTLRCGHTLAVASFAPALPTPVAVVVVDRVLLPDSSGVIPRAAAITFAESCRDNGPEKACYGGMPIPH